MHHPRLYRGSLSRTIARLLSQSATVRRDRPTGMNSLPAPQSQTGSIRLQVISDPEKRKVYDMYGEDGLKAGGGAGPQSGFPGGGMPSGFSSGGYQQRSANDIFAEVCVDFRHPSRSCHISRGTPCPAHPMPLHFLELCLCLATSCDTRVNPFLPTPQWVLPHL